MYRIDVNSYDVGMFSFRKHSIFLDEGYVFIPEITEWLKSRGLHKVKLLPRGQVYGSFYVEFPSTARKEAIYFKIKWC
jgi:hypothetical protein